MSPTVTTFLFEAANFLTLAPLLGWLFFQPVSDAIQGRRSAQQQLLDDATKKNADAAQLRSLCQVGEAKKKFTEAERSVFGRNS